LQKRGAENYAVCNSLILYRFTPSTSVLILYKRTVSDSISP